MLALTLPVAADPAAPAQLESDLREEIEVKLVSVDLRALGRGGDPVGDLGADEIVVSLGGRELEVAYLERVRPEPSREGVSIELAVATNAPSA